MQFLLHFLFVLFHILQTILKICRRLCVQECYPHKFFQKVKTVNNTPKMFRGKRVLDSRLECHEAQILSEAFNFCAMEMRLKGLWKPLLTQSLF